MPLLAHDEFTLTFPAIRGVQAGREYFVAMVRLSHLVKLVPSESNDSAAELQAQRTLNRGRVPALARYITSNVDGYVFSALTVSVGGEVHFEPVSTESVGNKLGKLHISADVPVIINDGQHRRAAIERALRERPELGRESIAVVLFVDAALERSQQRFADLNRYPIRPTKSLTILYDHRDPLSRLVNRMADQLPVFAGMTEKTKTTIASSSRKLFTLSNLYQATKLLIGKRDGEEVTLVEERVVCDFWSEVAINIPDWRRAAEGELHPADLRATCVHAHGVALQAIAAAGKQLLQECPKGWRQRLEQLGRIDWSRANSCWEGRALQHGRVSKAQVSVARTSDFIKSVLEISSSPNEKESCGQWISIPQISSTRKG